MKKKCTAAGCRKIFHYTNEAYVVCPFCGKEYPRLGNYGRNIICVINNIPYNLTGLRKINPEKTSKLQMLKEIRLLTGESLKACKYMTDMLYDKGQIPARMVLSGEYGRDIKMSGAIRVWKRRT